MIAFFEFKYILFFLLALMANIYKKNIKNILVKFALILLVI